MRCWSWHQPQDDTLVSKRSAQHVQKFPEDGRQSWRRLALVHQRRRVFSSIDPRAHWLLSFEICQPVPESWTEESERNYWNYKWESDLKRLYSAMLCYDSICYAAAQLMIVWHHLYPRPFLLCSLQTCQLPWWRQCDIPVKVGGVQPVLESNPKFGSYCWYYYSRMCTSMLNHII